MGVFALAYQEKTTGHTVLWQSGDIPPAPEAPPTTNSATLPPAPLPFMNNTNSAATLLPASTPLRGDTTDGQPPATNAAPPEPQTNAVPAKAPAQ
jgi:hypothetical protein